MLTKKKILLFTDWYEPGFKAGGPIRSCRNFVAAMEDEYDIYIVTSDRDLGDPGPYPGIRVDTWTTKEQHTRVWYTAVKNLGPALVRRLADEVKPDYVYLNSMYSFPFTLIPLWLKFRGRLPAATVLAPRGMLQAGALQFKTAKKKLLIKLLNMAGMPGKLIFHATDEQEKEDIRLHFPKAQKIAVLPNFPKMDPVEWKPLAKRSGELRCVFLSRLAPKKNLLFLLNVLKEFPAGNLLHLTLRGDIEEVSYWEKCLSAIGELPSHISVSYEGPVPNEEVIGVLQQQHLFVLPTLGENFGHAIFEAFLAGLPVLISDKTPWRQLEGKKLGHDLPLDPSAFGRSLLFFAAMDQESYKEWSGAALAYARSIQQDDSLKMEYKKLFA